MGGGGGKLFMSAGVGTIFLVWLVLHTSGCLLGMFCFISWSGWVTSCFGSGIGGSVLFSVGCASVLGLTGFSLTWSGEANFYNIQKSHAKCITCKIQVKGQKTIISYVLHTKHNKTIVSSRSIRVYP